MSMGNLKSWNAKKLNKNSLEDEVETYGDIVVKLFTRIAELIGDAWKMLHIEGNGEEYGCIDPCLKNYCWGQDKLIVEVERLGESYVFL